MECPCKHPATSPPSPSLHGIPSLEILNCAIVLEVFGECRDHFISSFSPMIATRRRELA